MQIKIRILLTLLPLLASACSETPAETQPQAGSVTVSVGTDSGIEIGTRTLIEEDGRTVRWTEGDKIALWAVNAASQTTLEAHPFEMYHYNAAFDDAKFTATIPLMAEDTYTYYAVSPQPDAIEGLMASFDIPSVQNGAQTLGYDVMVAAPVAGAGALRAGDNSDRINLQFKHKIHVLKIYIPENKMGLPVTSLTLTFPVPVTGRLTVDAADPEAPAQFSGDDAGKVLTLSFDTPKNAGDIVFAVIAPVELTPEDVIEIKAFAPERESYPATMPGKNYQAGRTTPITLTIPELYIPVTRIFFSLAGRDGRTDLSEDLTDGYGCSTLGEPVTSFTIQAPQGVDLGEGANTRTFQVNEQNKYEIYYEFDFPEALSEAADCSVTFHSEHAAVTLPFAMPKLDFDQSNTVDAFAVPYLFEERFNSVNGNGYDDDKYTGNGSGYELSNMGLPGWSGQRVGSSSEHRSVRVHSRHEGAWGINQNYNGRLTSLPLGDRLKGPVTVRIEFLSGGSVWGNDNGDIICQFGTTENTGNVVYDDSDMTGIGGRITISKGNGYNNIPTKIDNLPTFGASSKTRLSWKVTSTDSKAPFAGSYTSYYVYLDDIRVSIVR